MKCTNLLLLIAALFVCTNAKAYKEQSININVNGATRNMLVYTPDNMSDNLPLMIVTHGMNQNPEYQSDGDRFREIIDREKFVVAYLRSNGSTWDIGGDGDTNFVLRSIEDMTSRYKINTNRVYWSGFSMGTMLMYHSIGKLQSKIAAFAPTSGMAFTEQPWNALTQQINLIHCHSLSDNVFPVANYDFITYVTNIANKNGFTKHDVLQNYRAADHVGTKDVWTDERTGKVVALFRYNQGGHWPTVNNRDEIWNFCKQFTLNGKTNDTPAAAPTRDANGAWSYFGTVPDIKVDGKNLVDPHGRPVTLHGVMDTPSSYFNGGKWAGKDANGNYNPFWVVDYSDRWIQPCYDYFDKIFSAITDKKQGAYSNLFRLHLDPCWVTDDNVRASGFSERNGKTYDPHGQEVGGEANIYHFSEAKFRKHLDDLYMPIAENAIKHGLYVIIRPPGVFPGNVTVGDYYNDYLKKIWDIVSQHPIAKKYSGKISLELGNEPVNVYPRGTTQFGWFDNANTTVLYDYFQPIIDKIRDNGYNGILWVPGTGWQANYRSYMTKHVEDRLPNGQYNIGYAVHFYPGWHGTSGNDDNPTRTNAQVLQEFKNNVPVVDYCPVVITEVDWSPKDGNSGHYDEHGNWVLSNFGTWGTGSTTEKSHFGEQFKYVADQCGNVSWTIEGSDLVVDMDKYLNTGIVQPAFLDKMRAAGYKDTYQACSGSCFQWYKEYAGGDKVPMPLTFDNDDTGGGGGLSTDATVVGNANFNTSNGHYEFYTPNSSAFIFSKYNGTKLEDCADFTITLGDHTTGYRLDIQLKDAAGNIIKDGDQNYIIGKEENGTRYPNADDAKSNTINMQSLFADYLAQYPGCTVGDIRINTAVAYGAEDTERVGKHYITFDKMDINITQVQARKALHASLADIPMYSYEDVKDYIYNNADNLGGWGNVNITNLGGGAYELTISEKKASWEGQFNIGDKDYANGQEYILSLDIKGSVDGSISTGIQNPDGYKDCGNFGDIPVTTEWQTVTKVATVSGENARRILLNVGDYVGTLNIKNVSIYSISGQQKTEIAGTNISLNEEKTNGGEVFGAGLAGHVMYNEYADLTGYDKMFIKGSGDDVRILYNRPDMNSCPEIRKSLNEGSITIDLTEYPFFHLNSIKAAWGQTVNVESILLSKNDDPEGFADYYITGAGHINQTATAALSDLSATCIDITGMSNKFEQVLETSNPNCIMIYSEAQGNANLVGNVFGARNMVKKGGDYSSWMTNLTDGYDFHSPIDINTVGGATYTRNLSTEFATLVLPFELDLDNTDKKNPEIYTLKVIEGGAMHLNRMTSGKIPAGTAIIYRNASLGNTTLQGSGIKKTADGFNIQPLPDINGWYSAQSFTNAVIENVATHPILKDYDVYGISNDEFVHATKKLTLKPFRAFFLHKKTANAHSRLSIILDSEDGEATDIADFSNTIQPLQHFNVAGQRIDAEAHGIHIIKKNDGTTKKVMR